MRATGLAFTSMSTAEGFVWIVGLIAGINLMTVSVAQAQAGSSVQPTQSLAERVQANQAPASRCSAIVSPTSSGSTCNYEPPDVGGPKTSGGSGTR